MNKKIGVVTGSSKGIGKAISIAFAKSGEYFAVVTNARKLQEAQIVSEEIMLHMSDKGFIYYTLYLNSAVSQFAITVGKKLSIHHAAYRY